jgi:hypothetical protein
MVDGSLSRNGRRSYTRPTRADRERALDALLTDR